METILYAKAAAFLGAALVMGIGSLGPALGQGFVAMKAVETIGKYPENARDVRTTTFLCLTIIETTSIFCFVVAMMLLFVFGI